MPSRRGPDSDRDIGPSSATACSGFARRGFWPPCPPWRPCRGVTSIPGPPDAAAVPAVAFPRRIRERHLSRIEIRLHIVRSACAEIEYPPGDGMACALLGTWIRRWCALHSTVEVGSAVVKSEWWQATEGDRTLGRRNRYARRARVRGEAYGPAGLSRDTRASVSPTGGIVARP